MQFKSLAVFALSAGALAAPEKRQATDANLASIIQVLQTAVPTSIALEFLTNSAGVYSSVASELAASSTPSWIAGLPTDVKSYLASVAETPSAASSAIANATSAAAASVTSAPVIIANNGTAVANQTAPAVVASNGTALINGTVPATIAQNGTAIINGTTLGNGTVVVNGTAIANGSAIVSVNRPVSKEDCNMFLKGLLLLLEVL
ncbi:hypothetical protein E4T50_09376 [Aureobasidium sp. EXF-12298]|nr:hypothetical protein E4T50_09376 [Aureobasidium sp. EXF-12298]KAI4756569.1 hypothetical protein E4T51_10353 [Aureobasidium sp. EXF-12344]KAI4774995.1 hypothetical protein E4T52_10049 [Aureobasidium sp. EXF-3400]